MKTFTIWCWRQYNKRTCIIHHKLCFIITSNDSIVKFYFDKHHVLTTEKTQKIHEDLNSTLSNREIVRIILLAQQNCL